MTSASAVALAWDKETCVSLRPSVQINEAHSDAICGEVGYRLRRYLEGDPSPVPARISALLNRLRQLDTDETPPLVPLNDDRAHLPSAGRRR